MRDFLNQALNQATLLGADYADIRIVEKITEGLSVKNGRVEAITTNTNSGFGIRVLTEGVWGFAGSSNLTLPEIEKTTRLAFSIAKASATVKRNPVTLAPTDNVVDSYKSNYQIDPFSVSLEEKINLLLEIDKILRENPKILIAHSTMRFERKKQYFASSEGSYIEQEITESGGGISATAIEGGEMERRSYPNSMGGQTATRGYELIRELKLAENAFRIRDEAAALLTAKECPTTTTTVILDSSQVALQLHESIGHPIELDRILGMEASFAGTSFLCTKKLNKFQYGSEIINVTADATLEGALGSFGYDDEGVKAQKVDIIKDGILIDFLSSRETASVLGKRSNGTMRADSWNHIPLIRMTNINLLPGEWELEDLIADTKEGLFLATNKSWSIDDKRLNFQFATEIGWEIKNGKLGAMVKKPNYTGITPQFWKSCDALCKEKYWTVWGTPNCGKGEPMQIAHVAHGTVPARFKNVQVGVGI